MKDSSLWKSWPFYAAVFALWWYLIAFAIFPSLATLRQSIGSGNSFTLDYFKEFFISPNVRSALGNTMVMAFLTVLICGFMGISLALAINGVNVPLRKMWHIIALLPMVVPGTVIVVAYVYLYGSISYIGTPLREFFNIPYSRLPFSGLPSILFIHTFTQYIFFYLLTSEAVERINTSQIEAARTLGAPPIKVFLNVVLPSFGPALTSAAVLTFMSACASFSAPLITGGNYRVMSTAIYNNKQGGFINSAAAEAVLLFLLIITFVITVRIFELKKFRGQDAKGNSAPFQPSTDKKLKLISLIYLITISIMILLPIFSVILTSFGKYGTWRGVFHQQYTWENYKFVFYSARNLKPILNSTIAASIGTVGSAIIGVFAAYLITRTRIKGKILLESACLIPWLLPASATLIALIAAYNIPNILLFNRVIVGKYWFMPLAFMILRLPVMMRNASASLITLSASLEEASRSLGANSLQTFFNIILPLMSTGLSFSIIISFIFLLGDYGVAVFAAIPSNIPITSTIMSNLSFQRTEVGMVYGSCLIFFAMFSVGLFSL